MLEKHTYAVRDSVISSTSTSESSNMSPYTTCDRHPPFVLVSSPPKTGGPEMRSALLTLGLGPTMHTHELFQRDENFALAWQQALKNPTAVDWVQFLSDYDSGCGEPLHSVAGDVIRSFGRAKHSSKFNNNKRCKKGCEGYRRLKVVVMTRESEEWFKEVSKSAADVFSSSNKKLKFFSHFVPGRKQRLLLDILNRATSTTTTTATSSSPDSPQSKYHSEYLTQHRLELQRVAREAGLDENDVLVYDVSQGWEPLREFLGTVENPPVEFPGAATVWAEEAEDYRRIKKSMKIKATIWSILWLFVFGMAASVIARVGV